jgi:hypothetical protein
MGEKTQGRKDEYCRQFGEGGGGVDLIYVESDIQIDHRIRDNRRISCGEIEFEISVRFFKDTAQYRLKAQLKTYYCNEIREFTDQNQEVM